MLLSVAEYVLNMLSQGNIKFAHRLIFYKSIPIILQRSELNPGNIMVDANKNLVVKREELKVWVRFYVFLFLGQKYLKKNLRRKTLAPDASKVCFTLLGFNYFAIPGVKEVVVEFFTPYAEIDDERMKKIINKLIVVGEYEAEKYVRSRNDVDTFINYTEIYPLLRDNINNFVGGNVEKSCKISPGVLKRIKPSTSGYLIFLITWINTIESLSNVKKIPYNLIDGYYIIITPFLVELDNRNIQEIRRAFFNCTLCLLSNPILLNAYMKILFPKTDLYNLSCVTDTFLLLTSWMEKVQKGTPTLGEWFNYKYLFKCFSIMLELDHYIIVSNVLIFIHNFIHMFTQVEVENFVDLIIDKFLDKLFLNWSYTIRNIFIKFLVFKLPEVWNEDIKKKLDDALLELNDMDPENPLAVYADIAFEEYKSCQLDYEDWLSDPYELPKLRIQELHLGD
eukprot:TRINITY_DN6172_c0_g1_i1.p1 TRINITY_DN6172_c0_g1~~TRINITY_DN6172_c0_g1_i1.p1  ORF type:complete len:450 (-),score=71.38 TRINITY_DN6172_c0_g1_i1:134-1483(-)